MFRNLWENAWWDLACVGRGESAVQGGEDSRFLPSLRSGRNDKILLVVGTGGLESYEDWFWLEANAPDFFDALLDLVFQGEDFGGRGAAAIHDSERVLARNSDMA